MWLQCLKAHSTLRPEAARLKPRLSKGHQSYRLIAQLRTGSKRRAISFLPRGCSKLLILRLIGIIQEALLEGLKKSKKDKKTLDKGEERVLIYCGMKWKIVV